MKNDSARGWLLVFVQVIIFIVFALLPTREITTGSAVTGGLLIVVGAIFIGWAFISLGNALTANPVPLSHAELRTQSAFSVVRHPMSGEKAAAVELKIRRWLRAKGWALDRTLENWSTANLEVASLRELFDAAGI